MGKKRAKTVPYLPAPITVTQLDLAARSLVKRGLRSATILDHALQATKPAWNNNKSKEDTK